jgi:hypothetical protein
MTKNITSVSVNSDLSTVTFQLGEDLVITIPLHNFLYYSKLVEQQIFNYGGVSEWKPVKKK